MRIGKAKIFGRNVGDISSFKMPFGKYRGDMVKDIPDTYILPKVKTIELANAICYALYGYTQEQLWVLEDEALQVECEEIFGIPTREMFAP